MARPLTWLAAVGILAAGGAVVALQPQEQFAQGPIVVDVALGEQGSGRNIVATFDAVRLAEVVEIDETGWRGETEGVWVAVDVTVSSVVSPVGLQSMLLVDGRRFLGSDRIGTNGLESWVMSPGLPAAGTLLFEIPEDLLDSTAHVRVGTSFEPRLDSVIELTVDLAQLETEASAAVSEAGRVDP